MSRHHLVSRVIVLTACVVAPGVASAAGPIGFQSMTSQYRQGTSAFGSVEKHAPKAPASDASKTYAYASGDTRLKASDGIPSARNYAGVNADRKATREASAQTKVFSGSITEHVNVPRDHHVYSKTGREERTRTITAERQPSGKLVTVNKTTEQSPSASAIFKNGPVPERRWDKVSVTRSGANGVSKTTTIQSWGSVLSKQGNSSTAERNAAERGNPRSMKGANVERTTQTPTETRTVRSVIPPPASVSSERGTVATKTTLGRNEVEKNGNTGKLETVQKTFVKNPTTGEYESADRKP